MSRGRVLVTRSEPGASETADRLAAAGYMPIVEPVFTIEPVPAEIPEFDALAFTSANGARQFASLTKQRDIPVYCVGARTAEVVGELGFSEVFSANGDVHALAELILSHLPPRRRLLHAGNEAGRGELAGLLSKAGRLASFISVFRPVPCAYAGPVLAGHVAGRDMFDVALIHSARAAAILAGFASGSRAHFDIAAISKAAAAPLAMIAGRIEIAVSPDEQELLSALGRLLPG